MEKIVIECDKHNDLVLYSIDSKTNERSRFFRGREITDYLNNLPKKIPNVVYEKHKDEIDDRMMVKYEKDDIRVDVYSSHDNIAPHMDLLTPLTERVNAASKAGKITISNMSNEKRQAPPKVTRTNKFLGVKEIAVLVASGAILAGLLFAGSEREKDTLPDYKKPRSNYNDSSISDMVIPTATPTPEVDISIEDPDSMEVTNDLSEDESVKLDYEDRSLTDKSLYAKENYGELIEKYSNRYGLDANLMLGIATQERGVHSEVMDQGGATGLMQIQNAVWVDHEIDAYNFETEEYDRFTVTEDMLSDVETNIQIGCMVFQNCLNYVEYNIPLAIQCYNYGIGNMNNVIDYYANETGKTRQDVISNPSDIGWIDYRDIISGGDPNYLNNVCSWIGEENNISVMKKDNTIVAMNVSNNKIADKVY